MTLPSVPVPVELTPSVDLVPSSDGVGKVSSSARSRWAMMFVSVRCSLSLRQFSSDEPRCVSAAGLIQIGLREGADEDELDGTR